MSQITLEERERERKGGNTERERRKEATGNVLSLNWLIKYSEQSCASQDREIREKSKATDFSANRRSSWDAAIKHSIYMFDEGAPLLWKEEGSARNSVAGPFPDSSMSFLRVSPLFFGIRADESVIIDVTLFGRTATSPHTSDGSCPRNNSLVSLCFTSQHPSRSIRHSDGNRPIRIALISRSSVRWMHPSVQSLSFHAMRTCIVLAGILEENRRRKNLMEKRIGK